MSRATCCVSDSIFLICSTFTDKENMFRVCLRQVLCLELTIKLYKVQLSYSKPLDKLIYRSKVWSKGSTTIFINSKTNAILYSTLSSLFFLSNIWKLLAATKIRLHWITSLSINSHAPPWKCILLSLVANFNKSYFTLINFAPSKSWLTLIVSSFIIQKNE